jgi:outer membrane protein assembly factor BamA
MMTLLQIIKMPAMKNKLFQKLKLINYGCMLIMAAFLGSCISPRLVKENEYLYAGAKIKVHADKKVEGASKVKGILKDEVYPIPNRRILGIPYKLWIYNTFGSRKNKNKSFISNTYGERPVLMSDVNTEEVAGSLKIILRGNGYLHPKVNSEVVKTVLGRRQRKVVYHCYIDDPYHIRNINVDIHDSLIVYYIDSVKNESLLRPGMQYNLEKLKGERERIDALLKSKGFYYFSPEFLEYFGNDTIGNKQIDLYLRVKSDVRPQDLKPWYVNETVLINNAVKDSLSVNDTIQYKGVGFLTGSSFKPRYLRHFILIGKDALLTTENYRITNKNLSSLSAFKFANVNAVRDSSSNKVDINIDITPNERHNIRLLSNLVSKSNDFAGPGVELRYTNRNLLKGGEQLTVKTYGSIEGYLSKKESDFIGDFNYEAGASAELKFPRFLLINPSVISAKYVPNNHIRLDARFINQMKFYKMSFFRLMYGYRWAENEYKSHELNIIDITFQHQLKSTIAFDSMERANPLLKQSFADQFMVGTNYTFQYHVPDSDPRRFKISFTGAVDLSGNLLYGLQRLTGRKETEEEPLRFLGTRYAQYIKTTIDHRMYYDASKKDRVAFRLSAGLGLPVGNSGTLPGIKQYYLGGANSIRAFKFRSVGPGSYAIDTIDKKKGDVGLINHTGEVMLLGNIENRFLVAKMLEWAVFLDAGNIWLAKNDTSRVGGDFKTDKFLKQLAVGWGTGLRYINQYFIFRIDLGFPLHSPYGEKRSKMNTVWNFAFGYPF